MGKVMSLLFNSLSRFVTVSFQEASVFYFMITVTAMILEPKKIKSVTVSIFLFAMK